MTERRKTYSENEMIPLSPTYLKRFEDGNEDFPGVREMLSSRYFLLNFLGLTLEKNKVVVRF